MKKVFDTNEQYHSSDGISASGLKTISQKSVYNFLNHKVKTTAAMERGTAVHEALLEPNNFWQNYHIMPKIDLRTKEGKEEKKKQLELAKNKILLKNEDYLIIDNLVKNLRRNELAKKYCAGIVEQSHYFVYKNLKCRCRPDCFDPVEGWISDIKTINEISARSIPNEIRNRHYDLQAVAYSTWLNIPVENFRFIFAETSSPYAIEVVALSEQEIQRGKYRFEKAFQSWKNYRETGLIEGVSATEFAPDGAKIF